MKTKLMLFFAAILLFPGCSKEASRTPQTIASTATPLPQEDQFVESFALGVENMGADELLMVYQENGKIDWDVTKTSDKRYSDKIGLKAHSCEGTATAVARCAYKIISAGSCVIAGKTGDTCWADKVKCPV